MVPHLGEHVGHLLRVFPELLKLVVWFVHLKTSRSEPLFVRSFYAMATSVLSGPCSQIDRNLHHQCLGYAMVPGGVVPHDEDHDHEDGEYKRTALQPCDCPCHARLMRTVYEHGRMYAYAVPNVSEYLDPNSEASLEAERDVKRQIRAESDRLRPVYTVKTRMPRNSAAPADDDAYDHMSAEDFQFHGARTVGTFPTREDQMQFAVIGMAGEMGEIANLISKMFYQGHPYSEAKFIEEVGDLEWYICRLLDAMGVPLTRVFARNHTKLRKRYHQGSFSAEQSIARVDTQEPDAEPETDHRITRPLTAV